MDMISENAKWWTDARFGMFIHWGLPTLLKRGIWVQFWEHIPREEYEELLHQFDPQYYDPAEWVALARDAGMKYMVLTTRNHDGFCLFDTKTTDFNVTRSPAGRDLLAEFAQACHDADMPMGFYYSLQNWRQPGCLTKNVIGPSEYYDGLVNEAHEQIRELMSNYGKVDILWFDGLRPNDPAIWRSEELLRTARELQPDILINNRAGVDGDFGTPENVITPESRPWEACYTSNETWGYAPGDTAWKSPVQLLELLATCAAGRGNLLLNFPADPDGQFQIEAVERLRIMGQWLRVNGEAIYGSQMAPIAPGNGWATQSGSTIYLIVRRWSGSTVSFGWLKSRVISASVLSTGQKARVEQIGDRVILHDLPEYAPDPLLTVIKVEVDGVPERVDPEEIDMM
jgi:alpha-L-fucosidase